MKRLRLQRIERDTVYRRKHIDSLRTVRLRLAPTKALKREDDRIRTTIKRDSVRTIKLRPSRLAPLKREVELKMVPTKVKEPNLNINKDEVKEVRINQKVVEVAIVPKKAPVDKLTEITIVPKKPSSDKVIEIVIPTKN